MLLDVGANQGEESARLLEQCVDIQLCLHEPWRATCAAADRFAAQIEIGRVLRSAGPFDRFDAIVTETNYREIYADCVRVWHLEDLLEPQGFGHVDEICPLDPAWGDALYLARAKPSR